MLWSKHRFLAVQWDAYLADDLWLRLARTANARARALGGGLAALPPAELTHPVEANEVFVRMPERALELLEAEGFQFYRYGGGIIRLVTSFATSEADVAEFLAAAKRHLD
jgi:threonine aldolase